MTGLDKIIAQIQADSDSVCADIKSKTHVQCDKIIKDAQDRAQVILKDGERQAQQKKDEIISRAKSTADLESRAVILRAKQDIICSALDKARRYLCNLPDDEYFAVIYKMISKYSENSDGMLCLSKRDTDRLPADFIKEINNYSAGSLILQKEPVDIDGGFILIYGGIEVNCAFQSIFSAQNELFSDEASKILFA